MKTTDQLHADDVAAIDELRQDYQLMCDELGKVIVGQQAVVEQLAICLFARGHALLPPRHLTGHQRANRSRRRGDRNLFLGPPAGPAAASVFSISRTQGV